MVGCHRGKHPKNGHFWPYLAYYTPLLAQIRPKCTVLTRSRQPLGVERSSSFQTTPLAGRTCLRTSKTQKHPILGHKSQNFAQHRVQAGWSCMEGLGGQNPSKQVKIGQKIDFPKWAQNRVPMAGNRFFDL